jgi:hypothetical protein
MHINNSTDIQIRRRNYVCHDVITSSGTVGHLISTPAGYQLHTRDTRLRWFYRRYWRTPGHLVDAVRLQRLRAS